MAAYRVLLCDLMITCLPILNGHYNYIIDILADVADL